MSLNFPLNPSLNDIHTHNGVSYIWNSVKWVNMNKLANTIVGEYHNITIQTANTVLIEPDKYDYYKINLDEDITFDIPNASPNTSFVVEFNRTYVETSVEPTITWTDNIKWEGGIAPAIDFIYDTNILINFTTFDGSVWIANPLSLDLRNV